MYIQCNTLIEPSEIMSADRSVAAFPSKRAWYKVLDSILQDKIEE